ncbi:LysR substrate-binding domain-containing protein [Pseudomonas sp. zfem002]|uniref:LysR substrate-binding domain-containing protein n=1 Tax=Pseudomonas sp. zfem002 TaxID=3078197 RepID=UPI00292868B1|nr:LysR substrate-binding domain-containing protein [Pseudomonas sp. zfem002]MDU9394126.1 LysR substrate-binding domain-containing protein [Pseudomonas sp. zfem002]
MYDLNELYFFVQIVEHQGIAAASRALDIPKSRLSRHLAALEDRLGVRLINRSTRQFAVSDLGMEYYQHCLNMLDGAQAAQALIDDNQAAPRGMVRIACPTALLNFLVAGMIARFLDRHPEVEVHLESTNRQVDPLREGFDIALWVGFQPLEDSGLIMKRLSFSPQALVASPRLLERLGPARSLADLGRFPSLSLPPCSGQSVWNMEGPGGVQATVRHTPRLVTDDMITLRRVALEGGGIVQLPRLVVFKDIHNGLLSPLLADWVPRGGVIHALLPSRRGIPQSVRVLLDFLADSFKALDVDNLYQGYVLRGDEDACFLTNVEP